MTDPTFEGEDDELPVRHKTVRLPLTPDIIALLLQSHDAEVRIKLAVSSESVTAQFEIGMTLDNGEEEHNAKLN